MIIVLLKLYQSHILNSDCTLKTADITHPADKEPLCTNFATFCY